MEWRFELDLDRTNLWNYDITAYVKSAEWSIGATAPFATMANDAKLSMKVNNKAGWFNPEDTNASNPFVVSSENRLRPHRRARVAFNRYDTRAPSGIIQSLKLDELTGTTASDSSAENNDGTYTGAVLNSADSPIPKRRMPRFDGNDYVNLYSAGLLADFDPALGSVSLWIKPHAASYWETTNYGYIFRLFADGNNYVQIYKNNSPANWLIFEYMAGGTLEQVIVQDITVVDDALHVGMTWDKAGDEFKVYVNGVQQGATQTGLGTWVGDISPFVSVLGIEATGGTVGWNGYISHYRLYDTEITAANMAALATDGDEIMWVGWIKRIVPPYIPAGAYTGKTEASLICEGMKSRLETVVVPLGIYEDVTGEEVVSDALRLAAIPPISPGGWLAGKPGYSEAGLTTFAGRDPDPTVLETGITTFPLLGDKEQTGWQAIKLVTDGERAFFYQARDGQARWLNRHNRQTNVDSQATITDTSNPAVRIEYEWDVDAIRNSARVTVNPRKIASSATVYELQQPITVPPGAIVTFEAALRDADGIPGGATNLSGTPTFTGATPSVTLANLGSRAQITLDNSANSQAAILQTYTITGTPIQDRNPIIGTAEDAASIGEFGRREFSLNIPALSTLQQAQDVAQFEVNRRKDARATIDRVMFKHAGDDSDNTLQLDLTVNDRITLTLASKSHDADHFIIGEKHEWSVAGDSPIHETTYYLEPAASHRVWLAGKVGYSEAGLTTYGGF